MTWVAEEDIDIAYLTSNENNSDISDSSSDDEIERCEFISTKSVKDEAKNSCNTNKNYNVNISKTKNNHDKNNNNNKDRASKTNDNNIDISESQDVVNDSSTVKKENVSQNVVNDANKIKKEKRIYKCEACGLVLSKMSNLKRHIERLHENEKVTVEEGGNCLCLQCGYRCRYITQLRDHLMNQHNKVFRTETLEFENEKGKSLCILTF